jgi:hypothetical protein
VPYGRVADKLLTALGARRPCKRFPAPKPTPSGTQTRTDTAVVKISGLAIDRSRPLASTYAAVDAGQTARGSVQ